MKKQAIETRSQTYKRITDGIRQFINHSVGARKLIQEAKRTEIWKDKWSSWQEYCEKEFGKSRQRAYELLEVAETIDEIKSVCLADIESGKNKEILENLNRRQVAELKGLTPDQKAGVFHKAVAVSGGKAPKPETIAKVRRSSFDPDTEPRDNVSCYLSGPVSGNVPRDTIDREERDPADKMPKSTPEDVVAARMAVNPTADEKNSLRYPHLFSFAVNSYEEEQVLQVAKEKILVKRGSKNGHSKIDMRDAIAKVCLSYKGVTGKKLSVKPMDAGQLRRLFESGITLEECIEVGERAWVSREFWSKGQSHQLATFVKHFGTIRNEVTQETEKQQAAKSVNPQNYL